ncbi:MAG: site-specific DNA-methyltransferase [Candidatus Peregrinibacteria bacterium]|nr:site-specific DNA-methyltransferase [Candidatus Peregrinibacteria bacterium]
MPTIHFKGKTFLQNYHHSVKFHNLVAKKDKGLSKSPSLDDNLIIHGDNLKALKALLPTHAGKIKCIYIDPPYNTGNENWVYNDKVASPMIQKWLGEVVAKDNLTRHDRWCCMMYPRLTLLRELLNEEGVIFISIDDNEAHHLRMLMDDIFGEENFIADICTQLNPRGRTLDKFFAKTHEYILCYGKNALKSNSINFLDKEGKEIDQYRNSDTNGKFRELELRNRNPVFNRENRPNLYYPFYANPLTKSVSLAKTNEFTITILPVNLKGEDGCWTWGKDKSKENLGKLVAKPTKEGKWRVFRKDYLYSKDGQLAQTKAKAIWLEKEINNEKGKEMMNEVFGKPIFDFPKSVALIEKCVKLGSSKDSIILDSFAGSGTTAHATLSLNKKDGGNRKFILVECEDYADKITAERMRKVIKGIPTAKDKDLKKGLGGAFSYYELGEPVEIDNLLEGKSLPEYEDLAKYAFFMATGEQFNTKKIDEKTFHIGTSNTFEVFLIYAPDKKKLKDMALNIDFAEKINSKFPTRQKLVFAPACFMEDYNLKELNIRFAQLPFEIYRMAE